MLTGSPATGTDAGSTPGPRDSATPKPTATRAPTARPTPTPAPPTPAPQPTAPPAPSPCYVFPSSNVWNRAVSSLPVAANSAAMVSRHRPRRLPPSRLRRHRRRHPLQHRRLRHAAPTRSPSTTPTSRTRARIRSRRTRGSRRARTATCSSLDLAPVQAVGAVRRPRVGLELVGRFGRRLRPALERPAARRLDQRRRGRPADLPRPGPLRRGRDRLDRPRHPLHRAGHVRLHLPGPPPDRRRPARTCRRWACASA